MVKFLFIFCTLFSLSAFADDISLYVEETYFPFSNADGSGVSNTIVVEAYKVMGINVKLDVVPFVRMMEYISAGKALGGFNAIPIESEKNNFIFGTQPIYQVKTYIYYNPKKSIPTDSIAELNKTNLKLGEVRGYMYDDKYKEISLKRFYTASDEQLIKMLLSSRLDTAILTGGVTESILKNLGYSHSALSRIESFAIAKAPLHVAFNAKHPKANYYANILDQGLLKLKASGRYAEIIKRDLPNKIKAK